MRSLLKRLRRRRPAYATHRRTRPSRRTRMRSAVAPRLDRMGGEPGGVPPPAGRSGRIRAGHGGERRAAGRAQKEALGLFAPKSGVLPAQSLQLAADSFGKCRLLPAEFRCLGPCRRYGRFGRRESAKCRRGPALVFDLGVVSQEVHHGRIAKNAPAQVVDPVAQQSHLHGVTPSLRVVDSEPEAAELIIRRVVALVSRPPRASTLGWAVRAYGAQVDVLLLEVLRRRGDQFMQSVL